MVELILLTESMESRRVSLNVGVVVWFRLLPGPFIKESTSGDIYSSLAVYLQPYIAQPISDGSPRIRQLPWD